MGMLNSYCSNCMPLQLHLVPIACRSNCIAFNLHAGPIVFHYFPMSDATHVKLVGEICRPFLPFSGRCTETAVMTDEGRTPQFFVQTCHRNSTCPSVPLLMFGGSAVRCCPRYLLGCPCIFFCMLAKRGGSPPMRWGVPLVVSGCAVCKVVPIARLPRENDYSLCTRVVPVVASCAN